MGNKLYEGYEDTEVGTASEEQVFTDYEQFEAYRQSCKDVIAQSEAAARLAENKDFQLIIIKSFMRDEPMRLAELMSSGKLTEKDFLACADDMRGIGNLTNFMRSFAQKGIIASEELEQLEEARQAAIEEAAE